MVQERPTGNTHALCGQYTSTALHTNDSINFRINEQRIYDRDLVNPAHKYNELSNVYGKSLQVPTQLYSFDSDSDKSRADRQLNQNSVYIGQIEATQLPNATNTDLTNDIRGINHYCGLDLTMTGNNILGNGRRIGVKPIIIQKTLNRPSTDVGAREMRVWASVERMIGIKNGVVTLSH